MNRWLPLILLASAQFIMVLDTTVMNVAITQIVDDLDTTVQSMQAAITFYTLVMAAFMLAGAKLGDIFGRKQAFLVGLGIYGAGSMITAISQNMGMLYFGWSITEGIGAVLVIPAIAALVVGNYEGKQRALAYGVLGGIAAAGAALGPLIGGWMTTYASWRYVFAGETVCVIIVILLQHFIASPPRPARRPRFDGVGVLLSATGLGLIVFGILQSSKWGFVFPTGAMTINGQEITPFGLSMVPFFVAGGLLTLVLFAHWQRHRAAAGKDGLLDLSLLNVEQLRAGLSSLVAMQMMILGLFFTIPVFLQVVVGLDAFQTGLRIMPMSLSMLVAALAGPRMAGRMSARRITWIGLAFMLVGSLLLIDVIDTTLDSKSFIASTMLFGVGAGMLASQMGNVIMSSVDRTRSSEAGGLQGTAQNLGGSLGTALIGSILVASLTGAFHDGIATNPAIPASVQQQLVDSTKNGVPIVTTEQAATAMEEAGVSDANASAIVDEYSKAQILALKKSIAGLVLLAFAGFFMSRNLPRVPALDVAAPDDEPLAV